MAAAVTNSVRVAPGQDAQFLHKSHPAAPLTSSDGLRGEDHGEVQCNAILGISSFPDYNLVGLILFFALALPLCITVSLLFCFYYYHIIFCCLQIWYEEQICFHFKGLILTLMAAVRRMVNKDKFKIADADIHCGVLGMNGMCTRPWNLPCIVLWSNWMF